MPPPPPPEALAPAAAVGYVLADLAIILVAARIVGGIMVRLGQPRVVGEILSGILIGPTLLGGALAKGGITALDKPPVEGSGLVNDIFPLQAFSFLSLLGVIALVLFMFLVGLEVEQRFLSGRGTQIAVVAIAVVVVPVALGFLVGAILNSPGEWKVGVNPLSGQGVSFTTHALFIGAGLAVTAFPVMARILQEKRVLATPLGAVGVGAAAIVTPLMFIVVAGASASAKQQAVPQTVVVRLALAAALVALLFVVVRPLLGAVLNRYFRPDEPLPDELFAMLLVGAFATALAADKIGINALNGGFFFGACIPQVAGLGRAVVARLQQVVVVFLIPVFLAVAGLQTNFRDLDSGLIGGILLFLAAMIVGKWVVGAVAGRLVGLDWREANAIGVLMNCRGLMILVVALIGLQAGVVTPAMQIAFVTGAIVTTVMTGPLIDALIPAGAVEAERDKSISGSLAAIPTMSGGPRVLVVLKDAASAPAVIERGLTRVGGDPAPQFLIASLPGLGSGGDYVGAGPVDEEGALVAAARLIEPAEKALRHVGADVATAAFQSPEPPADLVKLSEDWAATSAIAPPGPEADALAEAGFDVQRA